MGENERDRNRKVALDVIAHFISKMGVGGIDSQIQGRLVDFICHIFQRDRVKFFTVFADMFDFFHPFFFQDMKSADSVLTILKALGENDGPYLPQIYDTLFKRLGDFQGRIEHLEKSKSRLLQENEEFRRDRSERASVGGLEKSAADHKDKLNQWKKRYDEMKANRDKARSEGETVQEEQRKEIERWKTICGKQKRKLDEVRKMVNEWDEDEDLLKSLDEVQEPAVNKE